MLETIQKQALSLNSSSTSQEALNSSLAFLENKKLTLPEFLDNSDL